jgi:hypothetical protein
VSPNIHNTRRTRYFAPSGPNIEIALIFAESSVFNATMQRLAHKFAVVCLIAATFLAGGLHSYFSSAAQSTLSIVVHLTPTTAANHSHHDHAGGAMEHAHEIAAAHLGQHETSNDPGCQHDHSDGTGHPCNHVHVQCCCTAGEPPYMGGAIIADAAYKTIIDHGSSLPFGQ